MPDSKLNRRSFAHSSALAAAAWLACAGATAASTDYDRDAAFDVSQSAIGQALGSHRLRDTTGQSFDLEQLTGKPVIVSLIYTSCHHVCPTITRNLANAVAKARDALGADEFRVVTIGFDWQVDSPERMRQYAAQHGIDDPAWHFLAADADSVERLTDALGFFYLPSAQGFDHLTQTTIVDGSGTIYRQIYGVDLPTQAVVEPLKQILFDTPSSAGIIEHWLDTLRLFCTVYDPTRDRYRFDYSILMTIFVGIVSLGAAGTFIAREWRRAS